MRFTLLLKGHYGVIKGNSQLDVTYGFDLHQLETAIYPAVHKSDSFRQQLYRQPIRSGKLKSVGYDFSRKILEVELHRGDIYQFFDVPPGTYYTLMGAESKNTYYDYFIYRKFPMRRL